MTATSSRKGRPRRRAIEAVRAACSTCWLCGFPIDMTLDKQTHRWASTVDEIIPVADNGSTTDLTNLRHSHRACNSKRGDQPVTPELRTEIRTIAAQALGHATAPGTTSREW